VAPVPRHTYRLQLLRSTSHLLSVSAFFNLLFTSMKHQDDHLSMVAMRHIAGLSALRRRSTQLQVLRWPAPRPISAAEEEALRCAARTEDASRWAARLTRMLTRKRLGGRAVLNAVVRSMIAREAKADALRSVRLNPDDAPPVFEALVALIFDEVGPRGACRVAMKHIDSASPRIRIEDCRGHTTEYELTPATWQLLARLPYISPEQPLLGFSLRSSRTAWRRICAMAGLPELSMWDVRRKGIRRRVEQRPADSVLLGSTAT
jgi:hypothetical protein